MFCLQGDIVLNKVSFAYPGREDSDVLRGVDLTLARGQVTALVGSSGAGKSTVTQLLCRFYDPGSGSVTVGGIDLRDGFESVDWLDAVALVGQEPKLFSGTVRENIAYGRAGRTGPDGTNAPTTEEIEAAAKAANAHEFILDLPDGYDTPVGEAGGALSGGQRQRVAIARAILKDAPVLILDEATSALDAESESLVQAAVNDLAQGRTTIVIAHRLATVKKADRIIVVDQCGDMARRDPKCVAGRTKDGRELNTGPRRKSWLRQAATMAVCAQCHGSDQCCTPSRSM